MGSEIRGVSQSDPLKSDGAPTARESNFSIGRYLAQQRVLRGISVDELAHLTKIPHRSIVRLEAGAFDREPDGFARGFVRTVAEALGLDPDDAVARLLAEPPEDDSGERRIPALRALTVAALVLIGLGVFGAALWGLTAAVRSDATVGTPQTDIVYRRDVVRELAELHEFQPGPGVADPLDSRAAATPQDR